MNVGDSVDLDIHVKKRDGTPLSDATEMRVRVYDPSGSLLTELGLGAGVVNLGSGNYRADFSPGLPGAYRALIRAVSPAGKVKNTALDFIVKRP
jgi:hypothetical protein